METIKTIQYKGEEIEIYYDENFSSDFMNDLDAFIVYDHRSFFVEKEGFNPEDIFEEHQKGKKIYDGHWFFPLFAYIHSGVSLSLSRCTDPLDTSFKGFVLVKREKGWSYHREKAFEIASSIIKTWNQYLGGEVYGYIAGDDSCWGYIGEEGMEQMIEEAKSIIDYKIKVKREAYFKKLKVAIKNRVPYSRRPQFTIL